jgi:hypothetical protein
VVGHYVMETRLPLIRCLVLVIAPTASSACFRFIRTSASGQKQSLAANNDLHALVCAVRMFRLHCGLVQRGLRVAVASGPAAREIPEWSHWLAAILYISSGRGRHWPGS